jgi:SPP1 gp7 family putative phage head morphogenesis protein
VPTPPHDTLWEPLPVQAIVDRFRAHLVLTKEQITELGEGAYTLAWSVANTTSFAVLQAMRESLAVAMEQGQTLEQWQAGLGDLVQTFTGGHLETIFRTTLATAYESQRFDELMGDEFVEYLVFDAINDDRVRPDHLALDGKAWLRKEFPPEYWPPLGYNCRCTVIPADFPELKALGAVEVPGRYVRDEAGDPILPPEGFRSAPSLAGLADKVRRDLEVRAALLGWGSNPLIPPLDLSSLLAQAAPPAPTLETVEITDIKKKSKPGVNPSYVGKSELGKVFIKPNGPLMERHRLRRSMLDSEQPGNEVAASLLNDLLGGIVRMPRVVQREVAGLGESIVMEFLKGAPVAESVVAKRAIAEAGADVRRLGLFDAITGNTDRHTGNAMWSRGHLVAIDHGLAFGNGGDRMRSFALKAIEERGQLALRPDEQAILQRVLDSEADIRAALERHLSSHRLGLIFDRVQAMLGHGSMIANGTDL